MSSLRFPFLFSQPWSPRPPLNARHTNVGSNSFSATAVACSVAAGFALSQNSINPFLESAYNLLFRSCSSPNGNHFPPMWGSLSLADSSAPVTESKTGVSFPSTLNDSQRLLGVGLRRKSVLGLKNIDVYAFGVYADDDDVKKFLSEKYGAQSVSELKENKEFHKEILESDIPMTVRLQIVYGRLSIRSVRSAFEESVGSRLQKFGGSDNKELLQRFTSLFKDEYKIPRGSVIDLSKEKGHVLRTTIDGKEVGSIQSKLLCRSVIDLYIGEDPFDKKAREDVEISLASLLQ